MEAKMSALAADEEGKLLLQTIIDSLSDAVSVVDENGIGIMINRAYTRITGLTEEQVLTKPASVDIAEGESVHMRVLQTKKSVRGVHMKVGPFRREVIVSCEPLIINGKLKGSVGVIHDISEVRRVMEELERTRRLVRRLESRYTFDDIIGNSKRLQEAIARARQAASTPACVLLRGECGTGKELFAHAIHHASDRANEPFIRVNCAALTDTLLESELFGYADGAFTGAKKGGRKGYFEEANGGTLFLDEIGAMTHEAQAKLLRAIQEGEVMRVGESRSRLIDVRVIAATNAELEVMVEQGLFRKDLYYRLNVMPIQMPPLREIKSDIPLLVNFCLSRYAPEYGRTVAEVTPAVYRRLKNHDWPGNMRELQNVISRALINMGRDETVIDEQHLTPFVSLSEKAAPDFLPTDGSLQELHRSWEKELLQNVLHQTHGNKAEAARRLKISIRNFYNKLHQYKLL
ncbi:MAG TPA: sigma 54-interacting transcriptional regulator [Candidatus Limnocylindrales bacterium]|nr:sigma 54-interacting transcriptional regulator [Candidatus Limnocylindrales bacterium]